MPIKVNTMVSLDEFEEYSEKLEEIADLALLNGTNYLKNNPPESECTSEWSEHTKEAFEIACYDGFKIAQERIIKEIMKYQKFFVECEIELKESRRNRDKTNELESLKTIKIIEQRISNFSHIADGIAWHIFGGQIHVARRMNIQEKSSKFLVNTNIESTIAAANYVNANPKEFALISDITGYIQIGDLIVVKNDAFQIIELKEGEQNKRLLDILTNEENEEKKIEIQKAISEFDSKTHKQFERMKRQHIRGNQVSDIIKNDEGIDPVSGTPIKVITPSISTEYYYEELYKMSNELLEKPWSYDVVDNCLHLGMYRDESYSMANFAIKAIIESETKNSIVIDFLSITNNLSEPIFFKPFPKNLKFGILTGKVKFILGINLDNMIECFSAIGVPTRWLSEKETAKRRQMDFGKNMIISNNRGIVSECEKQTIALGLGIISKIFYDSIRPSNIANSFLK